MHSYLEWITCKAMWGTFWKPFGDISMSSQRQSTMSRPRCGVTKSFNVHVMRAVYSWSRDHGRQIYFQSQNCGGMAIDLADGSFQCRWNVCEAKPILALHLLINHVDPVPSSGARFRPVEVGFFRHLFCRLGRRSKWYRWCLPQVHRCLLQRSRSTRYSVVSVCRTQLPWVSGSSCLRTSRTSHTSIEDPLGFSQGFNGFLFFPSICTRPCWSLWCHVVDQACGVCFFRASGVGDVLNHVRCYVFPKTPSVLGDFPTSHVWVQEGIVLDRSPEPPNRMIEWPDELLEVAGLSLRVHEWHPQSVWCSLFRTMFLHFRSAQKQTYHTLMLLLLLLLLF